MYPAEPLYINNEVYRSERRGVSRKAVIDAAKEKVRTVDLADLLCGPGRLRRRGEEWVGRCPLSDHEDRVPSFCVNPEKNLWYCHGCLRGGDVIELARHAWGYSKGEVAMAAADLLHEFGQPIPERPSSWYAKQRRQRPVRDALEDAKVRHLQRRIFRIFLPLIDKLEDEGEKCEETEYLWRASEEIAVLILAGKAVA